eukprot:366031-Chlamydomonas_euryale.AAC.5
MQLAVAAATDAAAAATAAAVAAAGWAVADTTAWPRVLLAEESAREGHQACRMQPVSRTPESDLSSADALLMIMGWQHQHSAQRIRNSSSSSIRCSRLACADLLCGCQAYGDGLVSSALTGAHPPALIRSADAPADDDGLVSSALTGAHPPALIRSTDAPAADDGLERGCPG